MIETKLPIPIDLCISAVEMADELLRKKEVDLKQCILKEIWVSNCEYNGFTDEQAAKNIAKFAQIKPVIKVFPEMADSEWHIIYKEKGSRVFYDVWSEGL